MVKCENAGLSSCRSIATGMVTYVDGDTKAAKAILNQAALTNSQQTLTQFIESLEGLRDKASVVPHLRALRNAAHHLVPDRKVPVSWNQNVESSPQRAAVRDDGSNTPGKDPAAQVATVSGPSMSRGPIRAITADTDSAQITTMTAVLSSERNKPCGSLTTDDARCLLLVDGPFVVTDLVSQGACDLFVAVGELDGDHGAPRWLQRAPLAQHALRVPIKPRRGLFVGHSRTDQPCAITFSGFRPYQDNAP